MILSVNSDYLNSDNQLIFVTVKCGVFFAVRTEFLNNILMSFGLQRAMPRPHCQITKLLLPYVTYS
jgi:hypothetical protein